MAINSIQQFGGDWTTRKLENVRKYLVAYATIMRKYNFQFSYIDAFAGTGYRELKTDDSKHELMFPEFLEQETEAFHDGSAKIALQVEPRFKEYVFVERNPKKIAELEKLKDEFPDKAKDIKLINEDANTYIQRICNKSWGWNRAVLFLDPFGMEVTWETIEAIAKTKSIDLWYLFPLSMGVNRMLTKNGEIPPEWRSKLDALFGCTDWYDAFYKTEKTQGLLFDDEKTVKTGDHKQIADFFVKRLKTVFAGVAENPLLLYNSRNCPLYLLCFAAGNPKGYPTAIKIAQDILKRN